MNATTAPTIEETRAIQPGSQRHRVLRLLAVLPRSVTSLQEQAIAKSGSRPADVRRVVLRSARLLEAAHAIERRGELMHVTARGMAALLTLESGTACDPAYVDLADSPPPAPLLPIDGVITPEHTTSRRHAYMTAAMSAPQVMRPGANDFRKHPSVIGNRLVYRDGQQEDPTP